MDEAFELFLHRQGFAPSIYGEPIDEQVIRDHWDKLPSALLEHWETRGFGGYGDGLLWVVNPSPYRELLAGWIEQTPLWGQDELTVFARTAFGGLYLWGARAQSIMTLDPHTNTLAIREWRENASPEEADAAIAQFFAARTQASCDYRDEKGERLFDRVLERLGHLEHDQMYSFLPAAALGGIVDLTHTRTVGMLAQLSILLSLDEPTLHYGHDPLFGELG